MFSGIVEARGTVAELRSEPPGCRLVIREPKIVAETAVADSICVNGCCLTVVEADRKAETMAFQAGPETLARTNLGDLKPGSFVNLERALAVGDRLGGHFVSGHIDGTGKIVHLVNHGQSWELAIEAPEDILKFCIDKGSIAVDGISLTIATLADSGFTCAVIPHTLNQTNLSERQAGDSVNLEADLIGKYVRRLLAKAEDAPPKITLESLTRAGFA